MYTYISNWKLKNWNEKKINASKSKLNVAINSNVATANGKKYEKAKWVEHMGTCTLETQQHIQLITTIFQVSSRITNSVSVRIYIWRIYSEGILFFNYFFFSIFNCEFLLKVLNDLKRVKKPFTYNSKPIIGLKSSWSPRKGESIVRQQRYDLSFV